VEIGNPDAGQSTQGPAARDPAEHSDPNQPAGKKKEEERAWINYKSHLKKKKIFFDYSNLSPSLYMMI
jgi:hypothetical protein